MESSIINHNQQSLRKCGATLKEIGGLSESFFSPWLPLLLRYWMSSVNPVAVAGRVALTEYFSNNRYLVGFTLGLAGFLVLPLYAFFPESDRTYYHTWYFVNWFYFLETIRLWLALILLPAAIYLHTPAKHKSIWVVYCLVLSIGVGGVVHYSFFVYDYNSYHSINWLVFLIAPSIGFGFAMATKNLVYRKYHLKDGNIARIKGIIKAPNIDAETKMRHLENLIIEQENYNERF